MADFFKSFKNIMSLNIFSEDGSDTKQEQERRRQIVTQGNDRTLRTERVQTQEPSKDELGLFNRDAVKQRLSEDVGRDHRRESQNIQISGFQKVHSQRFPNQLQGQAIPTRQSIPRGGDRTSQSIGAAIGFTPVNQVGINLESLKRTGESLMPGQIEGVPSVPFILIPVPIDQLGMLDQRSFEGFQMSAAGGMENR